MSGLNFSSEAAAPSEIEKFRAKVENGFSQLSQLVSAIRAPVPNQTGDGSELPKPDPPELIQKINETLGDLQHLGIRDVNTLINVSLAAKSGAPQDDSQYLMERLITVRLPRCFQSLLTRYRLLPSSQIIPSLESSSRIASLPHCITTCSIRQSRTLVLNTSIVPRMDPSTACSTRTLARLERHMRERSLRRICSPAQCPILEPSLTVL